MEATKQENLEAVSQMERLKAEESTPQQSTGPNGPNVNSSESPALQSQTTEDQSIQQQAMPSPSQSTGPAPSQPSPDQQVSSASSQPGVSHQDMPSNMSPQLGSMQGMQAASNGQQSSNRMQVSPETPSVEIKLFVGRVPRGADENVIRPVFEEYGTVTEIAIIKDRSTGMHKGSAFVRMASITQADAAIRALNNLRVLDPQLGALQVRYATGEAEKLGMTAESAYPGQDQAKLFVGSLPRNITEAEVREIFSPCGRIDEVFIMKDSATGQGKGCAFVKFGFKEQALHAIKTLSGTQQLPGAPRPLEVRFAESKKSIAANAGAAQPGNPAAFGAAAAGMALTPGAVAPNMARVPGNAAAAMAQQMMPTAATGAAAMAANQMYTQNTGSVAANPMMANHNPRSAGPWKEYFTDEGRAYYHNESTQQTQWERPAEFDRQDVAGPPGANIFVFHVPNDWTQQDLINNFTHFGPILSARIATDKATGRNKGYAFVSYGNIQSAAQAVTQMNGFMAGTKRLKVSIKQNEEMYVQHLLGNPMGGAAAQPAHGAVMPQASMLANTATNQSAAAMQNAPLYRALPTYGGANIDGADPSQMGAAPGAATGQQLNAAAGAYGAGAQAAVQSRYAAGPPSALHQAAHRLQTYY